MGGNEIRNSAYCIIITLILICFVRGKYSVSPKKLIFVKIIIAGSIFTICMGIENHILSLLGELKHIDSSAHLNERYLHHLFSRIIQQEYPVSLTGKSYLHPEWATYINRNNRRDGGRYRKKDGKYIITEDGSSGFIDFVIGHDETLDYAIEFKMSTIFNHEGLVFDFMKLLDSRNKFEKAISFAVYYGHSSHSNQCEVRVLNECLEEAKSRLCEYFINRPHWFVFLEITIGGVASRYDCTDDMFFVEIK